jgi:protein-L-isoaspartate(D-aspartate) O-methyltransferase
MLDFAQARRMMVDGQLRTFDVNDLPLLAVVDDVPRERFVPEDRMAFAYIDQNIPVSDGLDAPERRFMLAPMVLGRLIQALGIKSGDKVLDVACGLGYSSAVMARLGAFVTALEASQALAEAARLRLGQCGIETARTVTGPLERGFPDEAPYDAILINGAVEVKPQVLLEQLAEGGRLACIQGRGRAAGAKLYVRSGDAFGARSLFDAAAPVLMAFRAEPRFVF